MKFNLISIIYLLGALQAFVLLIGINLNKPLQTELKKIMSFLLLMIVVVMVYYIVVITEYAPLYPYVDSLGTVAWMAICPLYYLLCLSLVEPRWRLSWKHLLLFPVTIVFSIEAIVTTLGLSDTIYTLVNRPQLFLDLWVGFFFSTGIFFVVKSIGLIKQQEEERFRRELLWFSYLFLFLLVIFTIIYVFIREQYSYAFEYALIGLFELFIFAFIYRVFKMAPLNSFFNTLKYSNSTLVKNKQEGFATHLEQVMESEKPYLDKKLSLVDLSQLTDISANDLSQLFNRHYKASFYEYINKYRLDYVEQILLDPAYAQYKITAIAEISGFNSKTTFYKAFKERHEMTPLEYMKRRKN